MKFSEIFSAEDQLALWKLMSNNVWSRDVAQVDQTTEQKVLLVATPKPKKFNPKKAATKPSLVKIPKSQLSRSIAPSRPLSLASSQPVLKPTHASTFSQADLHAMQQQFQVSGSSSFSI